MPKQGLHYKLIKAFLWQILLISGATLLGVFAAAKIVEDVLVREALQGEAAHFWSLYQTHADFPRPNTANMKGYLAKEGDDSEVPPGLRHLTPGFGRANMEGRHPIVYVENNGTDRLYLAFDEQQVAALSFYFGTVPLSLVLVLIYLFAWLAYQQSKKAISPVIKLAEVVERFDFRKQGLAELDLNELRDSGDSDVAKLIDALDHFTERLELFIEREQNFTRDASHELRTPMAVIKSSLALLQRHADYQPNERHALAVIENTLKDMEELIETLLLLAREESSPLPEEDVLINDLLATLAEQVNRVVGSDHLRLEIEQNCLLSTVASEKVLHILFTNLLRNAFSYTREGTISIIIDENRVTVSDTGIGMEQAQLQQVFEPFYRAQNDNRGHGLGLTIVNRLCNRFGWQLKISSKPGEGTRVSVYFPKAKRVGGRR
ncbi:MAG: HAMP domain-containing sensor histidine kinase [Methylicorpusculum sp.]|uniref:sensor histidine kinase n=1 Tax=Methylicorpusculum sp. TaxID=2713644 RepID=UPI0027208AA2|nr:HAMP domain-containing sensor histidine kinase [Methylicorpusculum sp.]MDO8941033.1 HAMP domain-containing sensor histidine kinase [Methylicorpusculum sp.]MDP2204295.1 HAMP domain-containing sensor histidine kinase [Methylicorpusculum sp.]